MIPPELSDLLQGADPAAREAAWKTFLETHSRLLLHTARALGRDYDATMDAYAYLLEQFRRDDFHRLRAYVADGRTKFTTWLVVVARRVCLDHLRQRYGRPQESAPGSNEARAVRRRLVDLLVAGADVGLFRSAHDCSHGGLGVALAPIAPRAPPPLLRARFRDGRLARAALLLIVGAALAALAWSGALSPGTK